MPKRVVVVAPTSERLEPDKKKEHTVHVEDASGCLRAAAVGSRPMNVDLTLYAPDGTELGRDELPGPIALIGGGGPVCVDKPGDYRLEARVTGASGEVLVGVWRVP